MMTRSRSELGPSWPRASEPTAAKPMPESGTGKETSLQAAFHSSVRHCMASSVRALRLVAPFR